MLVGDMDDALPGGGGLGLQTARFEARCLRQRGSGDGRPLGGVSDVGDLGGVESKRGGWHEPDVERLPDGEDERVASRRELPAGLVDRELGQLGAVVGKDDGAPWRAGAAFDVLCRCHAASSTSAWRCGWLRMPASSGGESQAGPSPSMKRSRSGALRARAAEHVETDWDERAGDRETKADPQRDVGAGSGVGTDGGGEVHEQRSDHERGHRPEELDDREYPLQARGWE